MLRALRLLFGIVGRLLTRLGRPLGHGRPHGLPGAHDRPEQERRGHDERRRQQATLFRRASLPKRYQADGGRASIGSSARKRRTSAAKALAVS